MGIENSRFEVVRNNFGSIDVNLKSVSRKPSTGSKFEVNKNKWGGVEVKIK